jgi:4-diphosphocytidyl-2-C-methyl-D-erythritol kinase
MNEITLRSFAKINLTLEVLDKRRDGYHNLDSITQVIDICDEVTVCRSEPGLIDVDVDVQDVPSGKSNLVFRACRAFFRYTGIYGGAFCKLHKVVPVKAGLGGGSANAAAAIAGLDRIYDTNLTHSQLIEVCSTVGSDAALFIYGGTCRLRSRGEDVASLPKAPRLHLVVIKPHDGIVTKWAYGELDKQPQSRSRSASSEMERAIRNGDLDAMLQLMQNDFDRVMTDTYADIAQAKQVLFDHGALAAMLAGSGACVFGVFESRKQAEDVASSIDGSFESVFAVSSLPREESCLVSEGPCLR